MELHPDRDNSRPDHATLPVRPGVRRACLPRLSPRLVFTTLAGTPFEPRNFNRRVETRCARTGVRLITVQ